MCLCVCTVTVVCVFAQKLWCVCFHRNCSVCVSTETVDILFFKLCCFASIETVCVNVCLHRNCGVCVCTETVVCVFPQKLWCVCFHRNCGHILLQIMLLCVHRNCVCQCVLRVCTLTVDIFFFKCCFASTQTLCVCVCVCVCGVFPQKLWT